MQITINDETIDFRLENEANLYDVLVNLNRLLESEGLVLSSATTDQHPIDLNDIERLKTVPVDDVDRLAVRVQGRDAKAHDDLSAVAEFMRILKEAVRAGDHATLRELLTTYDSLRSGLDPLLESQGILDSELASGRLHELVLASGLLEGSLPDDGTREELFGYIDALRQALAQRTREIEDPRSELDAAASELRAAVDGLNEVSVLLQTGKDQEAMQEIIRFVELSSRIVRLYPNLQRNSQRRLSELSIDGVTFAEFFAEFNQILGELIDAFSAQDSVLIGDLLEYEVSPRLETLRSYIDLLTGD